MNKSHFLRRGFLIRVVATVGMKVFVQETGFNKELVLDMTMGQAPITHIDLDVIYQALSRVTACQKQYSRLH